MRTLHVSLTVCGLLCGLALVVALTRTGSAQVGGSQPSFVGLQSSTPGTAQAGHSSITGTGLFGTRVGIGTTAPSDPLNLAATGYGFVHRSGTTELGTFVDGSAGWLGTRSGHPLNLFVGNGPARLTVAASGFVGVGTNSPTALLDVAGTAKLTGLQVPTGAGVGKVLTSDAAGNASWQTFGGLSLPFAGSANYGAGAVLDMTNTNTATGWGLRGASAGHGSGVFGTAVTGYGVYGWATSASAVFATGVFGQSSSNDRGYGVAGHATAPSGPTIGVYGVSHSTSGTGVYGYVVDGTGSTGVVGASGGVNSIGVRGECNFGSNSTGVVGTSASGTGVAGSGAKNGVTGQTSSDSGIGVLGTMVGNSGYGVRGIASSYFSYAVDGANNVTDGIAVVGEAPVGANAQALYGYAPQGYGVTCHGRFIATGTKSFRIDHPSDPENDYLFHYCSEGPEPLNAYGGNVVTNERGFAKVTLPAYFEDINRDF